MHFSIMQLAMAVAIAIDFTVANFVAQLCLPIWLANLVGPKPNYVGQICWPIASINNTLPTIGCT